MMPKLWINEKPYSVESEVQEYVEKLERLEPTILKRVDYSCPLPTCKYKCSLDLTHIDNKISEFSIPPYMCPNPENNHKCPNPDSVGLNINLVFGESK